MPSINSLLDKHGAVPIMTTFPDPEVEWLTPAQFERRYGYPPGRVEDTLSDAELAAVADKNRLTLTEDRLEAFDRLVRLWNGECVGPGDVHLIADRIPSWEDVLGDLEAEELAALRPSTQNVEQKYIDEFGDREWFNPSPPPSWLRSTYIARNRADYDITERARTLVTHREDLPNLHGDPHEGLTHRVGVGIEAARATITEQRRVETYVPIGGHVVDLLQRDRADGAKRVGEMMTGHHNNQLNRSTWRKLEELGYPSILIFDDRATARRVLNHWNARCVDVPGAPFESDLNVSWTRKKFTEAANDPTSDWPVEDILTITSAWSELEQDATPTRQEILSVKW
ncbi:hypothetical protein CP556_25060 [Natrinema sp. CBA1119]|nr:hypothetical protein CP556_25060 [Natrinema sp. CBA1119]